MKKHHRIKISIFDKDLLIIFIISKTIVIVSLISFFYYFDELHAINNWYRYYSGKEVIDAIFLPFSNWDGQHYLLLADRGYEHSPKLSQAFFPMFPILISFTRTLFNDIYLSSFVLNIVFSYLFMYILYSYIANYLSQQIALKAVICTLSYPAAFYLSVFYSEALFILLLFSFIYFYDIKQSYYSLLFAVAMPLTKGHALFVMIALLIILTGKIITKEKFDVKYEISNICAFIVGGVAYGLFFYFATGSVFSGIEAQKLYPFGNSLINVINPIHFIEYLFSPIVAFFGPKNALIDKSFVLLFLVSFYFIIKTKKIIWIIFYFILLYPVASMGYGGSFTRFSLLLVPFLSIAIFSLYAEKKYMINSITFISICLQLLFIYRFSINKWVG